MTPADAGRARVLALVEAVEQLLDIKGKRGLQGRIFHPQALTDPAEREAANVLCLHIHFLTTPVWGLIFCWLVGISIPGWHDWSFAMHPTNACRPRMFRIRQYPRQSGKGSVKGRKMKVEGADHRVESAPA
jgi:hypothetical protein